MTVLFIVLILITCVVLGFFVLIQNPKGGGLAGSFGGFGNQMMGAKQSTDVVEKGTWIAAAALLVLTLGSFILAPTGQGDANEKSRAEKVNTGIQAPAMPSAPAPGAAAPAPAGQAQQAAPPAGSPEPAAAPQAQPAAAPQGNQ